MLKTHLQNSKKHNKSKNSFLQRSYRVSGANKFLMFRAPIIGLMTSETIGHPPHRRMRPTLPLGTQKQFRVSKNREIANVIAFNAHSSLSTDSDA